MKKVYKFSFLFLSLFSFGQAKVFDFARNGTVQQMDSLYQMDPSVIEAKSNEGFSPMILAAYKNNLEIVDYLIQKNIELNISSPMGTPLMAAVVKNNAEIVLKLLKAKADPNITDANGSTALHYAVLFKLYDLIPLLINYQANVNALDNNKKSPKMFAIDTKDEKLITLFK